MKSPFTLFKSMNKRTQTVLAIVLAVGVLFMLIGRRPLALLQEISPSASVPEALVSVPGPEKGFANERDLEKRLEEAFSMIENVGRVRVLLSFTPDRETTFAKDVNANESYSREIDSQGGSRETRSVQNQDKTIIITDRGGVDRPLVLRETEPKIAGVVIIAEGGDSVFVRDALTRAACTVLAIEANKVQVMKMKN
jgi:stage III sporulation protein AG